MKLKSAFLFILIIIRQYNKIITVNKSYEKTIRKNEI